MLARIRTAIRSFFRPVLRDRCGAAAILWVAAIVPVFGAAGLAVDSSLGYLLKSRMSKSLDTAGLAAGRVALNDDAEEVAREYFDANFGELGSVELTDFDFELDETEQFVTLTATASTPTVFMRVFGQDEMNVSARTVIQRKTTGMELALVLDNTGSMWGPPFNAMQNAAFELIDIIYGEETEIDNLWVSVVPYRRHGQHRHRPAPAGWPRATGCSPTRASFRPDLTGGGWRGCVMAQAYPRDASDDPPSVGKAHLVLLRVDHAHAGQQLAAAQDEHRGPQSGHESNRNTARARTSAAARRSRR